MPTTDATPTTDSIAATIFSREPMDPRVIVADGYGITVTVERGHLVVNDGLGSHRRKRRYSRIERAVRRLVIMSDTGYVSFEALKWCRDVGVTVVTVDRQGHTIATTTVEHPDARLIRAQAFTGTDGPYESVGLDIVRMLLDAKLSGQRDVAQTLLNSRSTAEQIDRHIERLINCASAKELRHVEANAALSYWSAWTGLPLPWRATDVDKVPEHWLTYGQRKAIATRGNSRHSTDPTNSILNYAYTLATAECRLALIAVGLDPTLGYLHLDEQARDSLALDLVEVIRPDIDAWVLSLLNTTPPVRHLDRRWFREQPDGTCRLVPPLTHLIAEQMPLWASSVSPYVDRIARMISDVGKGDVRPAVRLKRERAAISAGYTSTTGAGRIANRPQRGKLPATATVEAIVPDSVWALVEPLIPQTVKRDGRPWADSRAVLAGILCVEMHGASWAQIPATLGVTRWTCKARLEKWRSDGVWETIYNAFDTSDRR